MNYQILKDEIENDPLGRGYSGMNDQEIANDLNTNYRTRNVDTLSSAQIFEATDAAEFQALSDTGKGYVRDVWGLGDSVVVSAGSNARGVYLQFFNAQSITRSALLALLTESISRAVELGLGVVNAGEVTETGHA